MKLILTLTRNDDPQGLPIDTRSFVNAGLTLGRGDENDWVLDDPNRHLSKSHCAIAFEGGEFLVTDTSTNGVFVNQAPERLGRGNTMGLRDGDVVGLGEYLVRVEVAADDGAAEMAGDDFDDAFASFGTAPADVGFGGLDDPFAADPDLPGHAQTPDDDPFAEIDLPGPAGGESGGIGSFDMPEPFEAQAGTAEVPTAGLIPDDFDLLGDDGPGPEPAFGSPALAGAAFEGDVEADHVPSEGEFFRPPAAMPDRSLGGGIPDDWDAEIDMPLSEETIAPVSRPAPPPIATPRPAAARPDRPTPSPGARESAPAPGPVLVQPIAPATSRAPEHAGPPSGSAPGADAFAAFLSGAGLDPAEIPAADVEATMRVVGEAFREMVKGLQETLHARSEIKSEFRLERTMIRPQENNPLKFSPNVDEALAALLKGGGSGAYLKPVAAVHEGFNDLKAHQMAVMAGMQVALSALLTRFDPGTLEKRLKSQSVLDTILPAARKARYWELYEELYKQIAREAEDDFQGLFGREFATAYEGQVKKL